MGSPAGKGSAEPRLCAILQTCLSMLVPNHKKPLHLTLVGEEGAKLRPRQDIMSVKDIGRDCIHSLAVPRAEVTPQTSRLFEVRALSAT